MKIIKRSVFFFLFCAVPITAYSQNQSQQGSLQNKTSIHQSKNEVDARAVAKEGSIEKRKAVLDNIRTTPPILDNGGDSVQIAGNVGGITALDGIEWQVDMPWRMEPETISNGRVQYDPIPITFTIHDIAQRSNLTASTDAPELDLKKFCGLYIIEFQPGNTETEPEVTFVRPNEFYEIEASKRWNNTGTILEPRSESHKIARLWDGAALGNLIDMDIWDEWNGTAYYNPIGGTPRGGDLRIIAAAKISTSSNCGQNTYTAASIVNKLRRGNDFRDGHVTRLMAEALDTFSINYDDDTNSCLNYWPPHVSPEGATVSLSCYSRMVSVFKQRYEEDFKNITSEEDAIFFGDFLRTHYAAQPLPRFDENWLYGDLHYHSQGTDNEGESGTSYRSALASVKAMGLDFIFATDHASDTRQLTGIERVYLTAIPGVHFLSGKLKSVPGLNLLAKKIEDKIESAIVDALRDNGIGAPTPQYDAYRDMGQKRFAHLLNWQQGPSGGNAEINERPGSRRRPQLFIGGEVDVVPISTIENAQDGSYAYGAGNSYNWLSACYGLPDIIIEITDFSGRCRADGLSEDVDGYITKLRDVQGLGTTSFFARQHVVYLPREVKQSNPNQDMFLKSRTSDFGGATRLLQEIIDEMNDEDLGYLFLAHPANGTTGRGIFRLGPDMYPYSPVQLEVAFAEPRVLGLQVWNENPHLHSLPGGDRKFPFLHGSRIERDENGILDWSAIDWDWQAKVSPKYLGDSLAMWDMVNLWGITPSRLQSIGASNTRPRKFFMAGGSDAHGDLNYRREGAFTGWVLASNTAIGSPRNLVYIPSDGNNTIRQNKVLDGLKSGKFIVTDGPAVRMVFDKNSNGELDINDVQMGESHTFGRNTKPLRILVEWKSTPEFGPVHKIELTLGVQAGNHKGLIYKDSKFCPNRETLKDDKGNEYCEGNYDGEAFKLNGALKFDIPQQQGFGGKHVFVLNPKDYPLFDKECANLSTYSIESPRPKSGANIPNSNNKPARSAIVSKANARQSVGGSGGNDAGPQKPGTTERRRRPDNIFGDPLDDLLNPDYIPPNPQICKAVNVTAPARMFVRAKVTSKDTVNPPFTEYQTEFQNEMSISRRAFTNPIWFTNINQFGRVGDDLAPSQTSKDAPVNTAPAPTSKPCSKSSISLCQRNGASCDVLKDTRGSSKDVCRWTSKRTSRECNRTIGIWTAAQSKYAITHPGAIIPGTSGACITEVTNVRNRIQ